MKTNSKKIEYDKKRRAMKEFRNRIRHAIKHWNADFSRTDYLNGLADRLGYQFIKWDANSNSVLVFVYDKKNKDKYANDYRYYEWIYADGRWNFSHFWELSNEVYLRIRQDEGF